MVSSDPQTIESLPNEILISILSSLPTPQLLPLASVSRRFHALVLRILRHRLAKAASPDLNGGRELILECYHPSAKLTTPYLYCDHLGTTTTGFVTGFPSITDDAAAEYEPSSLGELQGLYSRFRPVVQEENRRARRRYPLRRAAAVQVQEEGEGSATTAAAAAVAEADVEAAEDAVDEPAILDVHLDDCESFSQLCTVTNLVRMGPRRGVFRSLVNVGDGVIRVWRGWLAARATAAAASNANGAKAKATWSKGGCCERGNDEEEILWADARKHVGVRFKVVQAGDDVAPPLLVAAGEDLPVSYRLEFEELLVRTTQVLLMAEKSDEQELEEGSSTDSSSLSSSPFFIGGGGAASHGGGGGPVARQPVQMMFFPSHPLAVARAQEGYHFDRLQWMGVPLGMMATA